MNEDGTPIVEGQPGAPAAAVTTGAEGNPPAGATTGTDGGAAAAVIDITPYIGTDGTPNTDAIMALVKDKQAAESSRNFYQGKYSRAMGGNLPKSASEYGSTFKADSAYEKFLEDEKATKDLADLKEFCHKNKLTDNVYNLMADKYFKDGIAAGTFDNRSDAEKQAAELAEFAEMKKAVDPMLQSLGRDLKENDEIIEGFMKSQNIFTHNKEVADWIQKNIVENGAMGYIVATLMTQGIQHSGIPSVKTADAAAMVDRAALDDALQKEADPNKREAMLRDWHTKNGIPLQ